MHAPRVFIVWAHPLFDETMQRLLQAWGVKIVGSMSDPKTALEEIEKSTPEVVILEDSDEPSQAEEQQIMAILHTSPLVIRLNLKDNELKSYRRERHTVGKIDDLANLLMPNNHLRDPDE
jgi:DNA-binding NarL/FixJ family response regulator